MCVCVCACVCVCVCVCVSTLLIPPEPLQAVICVLRPDWLLAVRPRYPIIQASADWTTWDPSLGIHDDTD